MQQEFLTVLSIALSLGLFFYPGCVRSYIHSFWAQVLWAVFSGFFKAFIITITWEHVKVSHSLQRRFNSAHFSAGRSFFNGLRPVQTFFTT